MSVDVELPEAFRARVLASGRREWAQWLNDLPEIVTAYIELWELTLTETFPLSWNYVVAAERASGEPCVLKVQPVAQPDDEGAVRESRTLHLAGSAAVRVLEEDAGSGVLLLERALPGDELAKWCEEDDDTATELLAGAMQSFGVPAGQDCGLPGLGTLASVFERFDSGPHGDVARAIAAAKPSTGLQSQLGIDEAGTGIPAIRRARITAERVMSELEADRTEPVLLHGDLHHGNVLAAQESSSSGRRPWLVIDPKGFFGEAAYEVATALHNPLAFVDGIGDLERLFRRRIAIFADVLLLDRERVTAWGFVNAVLSGLWTLEDGGSIPADDMLVRAIGALRTMI